MVSNPFSDLSVRITANTRDFESGIEDSQGALRGLSATATSAMAPLQALQNRVNEARDEFSSLDRSISGAQRSLAGVSAAAGASAGAFGTLAVATKGLSSSFGSLSVSLTGTVGLIGAVGAAATGLVSTLVPLAAIVGTLAGGVGALAAAFGAVIGTGILAFGEKRAEQNERELAQVENRIEVLERLKDTEEGLSETQQDVLESLEEQQGTLEDQTSIMGGLESAFADLKEELAPIITDFGEQFVPLIEDTIDAIPQLVRNIFDAIGGLDRFESVLRTLGRQAFRVIPQLTRELFDLARMALPVFMDFVGFISNNASGLFSGMLRTTRQLAPVFMQLFNSFVNALPDLNKLGSTVLQVVIPAFSGLLDLISGIVGTAEDSNGFADFLSNLVQQGLTWLRGPGAKVITTAGNFIIDELISLISPTEGEDNILSAFINRLADVLTGVENWLNNKGQEQITSLLTTLMGGVSSGLSENQDTFVNKILNPLAGILSNVFAGIANALASDEANQLTDAIGQTVQNALSFVVQATANYIQSDQFLSDMNLLKDAIANVFAGAIKGSLFEAVKRASPAVLIGSEIIKALGGGPAKKQRNFSETAPPDMQVPSGIQEANQQNRTTLEDLNSPQNIEVVVKGDTGVVEEVYAREQGRTRRRAKRLRDRGTGF